MNFTDSLGTMLPRTPARLLLALAALSAVAVVAVGGLALMGVGRSTADATPPAPVIEQVAANGIVEGVRPEAALRPEVAGVVAVIHVRENQEVAAGDLLVELRNAGQKAQLALARAQLAAAQAQFAIAEAKYRRSANLTSSAGAVAREQHEEYGYNTQLAQARVKEAQARLDEAQAELDKTYLKAPAGGRVLHIYAEPGESVGPNSAQPVLILADLSKRRVRAFVEELDISRVRVGQPACILADAWPDRHFPGVVALVLSRMGKRAPHSDTPGEYKDVYYREVLIDLEPADELPLNLRVQVRIETGPAGSRQRPQASSQ
jgi:multidrug efflux pump subunit AcrA (membrane-fusion protein)